MENWGCISITCIIRMTGDTSTCGSLGGYGHYRTQPDLPSDLGLTLQSFFAKKNRGIKKKWPGYHTESKQRPLLPQNFHPNWYFPNWTYPWPIKHASSSSLISKT